MNMFEATKVCLRKSFTIKGRASKSEFWGFYFSVLSFIVLIMLLVVIFTDYEIKNFYRILMIIGIFLLIPITTAKIRRLHDTNKSGWFALIGLIPWIGEIYVELILLTKPSVNSNNLYDATHHPVSDSKSIDLKSSKNKEIYSPNVSENGNKLCPFCAEIIKVKAIKCKHCHSAIEPDMVVELVDDIKLDSEIHSDDINNQRIDYEIGLLGIPLFGILALFFWVSNLSLIEGLSNQFMFIILLVIIGTAVVASLEVSKNKGENIEDFGSPIYWMFTMVIFWIFSYPIYLGKREKLGLKNRFGLGVILTITFLTIVLYLGKSIEDRRTKFQNGLFELKQQIDNAQKELQNQLSTDPLSSVPEQNPYPKTVQLPAKTISKKLLIKSGTKLPDALVTYIEKNYGDSNGKVDSIEINKSEAYMLETSSDACGSMGCDSVIIQKVNNTYQTIYEGYFYEIKRTNQSINGFDVLEFLVHGSVCNRVGSDTCHVTSYWTGSKWIEVSRQ